MMTRIRNFSLTTLAFVLILISSGANADGDAEKGRLIGFTCLGCHGIDGYRNAYPSYHVPKLQGQNPEYLRSALLAYREGRRDHRTMNAQGSTMTDDDIEHLVAWMSRGEQAQDTATEAELTGVVAVPVCTTCHGANPTAATPDTPVLSGQHENYLVQALMQYRDGSRTGNVMTGFAATLSEDEIEAVAEFYAVRPGLETLDARD